MMSRVPEPPGILIPRHSDQDRGLKYAVAQLCQLDHDRFPGSQPVSFGTGSLRNLEIQDYWVCEKSDGVRVLLFIFTDRATSDQTVFLIDRRNEYRELHGLYFPHHENPMKPLQSTLIDAELVYDRDPTTKREMLRLLAFDALLVNGQNVMSRPLDKRYGRLREWFYKPYAKMMRDHPHMTNTQPFQILIKEMSLGYGAEKIFNDITSLQHGNDGLIYTCLNAPYTPGTDVNVLKWKPPSENSIDFKLVLRFPPHATNPKEPDFHAKPVFALHVWCGGSNYEQYDELYVDDDEWERMKESGEQIDDRIVEVHWDANISGWRMMRFRDDKPHGNHKSVVDNIIQSIADGVDKATLLAATSAIRNASKARQSQSQRQPHAQALQPPVRSSLPTLPRVDVRYGPLAPSRISKVGGPETIAGMKR